jgi:hypothetical protein
LYFWLYCANGKETVWTKAQIHEALSEVHGDASQIPTRIGAVFTACVFLERTREQQRESRVVEILS